MAKSMTEDEVRRQAHRVLGFDDVPDSVLFILIYERKRRIIEIYFRRKG